MLSINIIQRLCDFVNLYAFYERDDITRITIPNCVTSIGDSAFYYCYALRSIIFGGNSQLTSIGWYAFECCYSLTSIVIPESVTSIGWKAFDRCHNLLEVYNLSHLNITIGSNQNGDIGCYGKNVYTDISIPSKFIERDGYILYCDDDKNEYFLMGYTGNDTQLSLPDKVNGHNYEIYQFAFYNRDDITGITIPDSVTSIGEYAFDGCTSLTSVVFGENSQLTSIGDWAFYDCTSLMSIVIPEGVTSIGEYSFGWCDNLTSVVFGEDSRLTDIGDWAFIGCTSLTSVVIPHSVTSIGSYAFDVCRSLTTIYYTGSEEDWAAISIGSYNSPLKNATIVYNYVPEE